MKNPYRKYQQQQTRKLNELERKSVQAQSKDQHAKDIRNVSNRDSQQ